MGKIELEIKYQIKDPGLIKSKLKKIGARFIKRELEQDKWFAQDIAGFTGLNPIRLRITKSGGTLTLKGPYLKSRYKKRLELQLKIDDPETLVKILEKIGFREGRRIEKIRETYRYKNSYILLDKLPFMGHHVEIEGSDEKIGMITKMLGLDEDKGIKESYSDLFNLYKMVKATKDARYKDVDLTFQSESRVRKI